MANDNDPICFRLKSLNLYNFLYAVFERPYKGLLNNHLSAQCLKIMCVIYMNDTDYGESGSNEMSLTANVILLI